MFKHFAMAIATFALMATAQAQTASDKLSWNADGTLSIDSVVLAPNSCYTAGKAVVGTPPSERPILNALPVTYPIFSNRTTSPACLQVIKPLKFSLRSKVPSTAKAVVIYEVIDGKVAKVRTLALPPRYITQ